MFSCITQSAAKGLEVWSRTLSNRSVAVVLLNRNTNEPQEITADFSLVCITWAHQTNLLTYIVVLINNIIIPEKKKKIAKPCKLHRV